MPGRAREILRANLEAILSDEGKQYLVAERAREKGHEISQQYISLMVLGKARNPGLLKLEALAAGLDVEFHELFKPGMKPVRRRE